MIDERLETFFRATARRRAAMWRLPSTRDRVIEWLAESLDCDRDITADERSRFEVVESLLDPESTVVFCHAIHRRTLLPESTWHRSLSELLPGLSSAIPPMRGKPDVETLCRAIAKNDEDAVSSFLLAFARGAWNPGILLDCDPNPIRLARLMKRTRFARLLRKLVDGWDPHSALDRRRLLQLADEGDPHAQFQLGMRCRESNRHEEAFRWFQRSAAEWLPESIRMVGFSFEYGEGVKRNLRRASDAYRDAALIGDYRAALGLAIRYENGDTVRANAEEAVYWLQIAAEHGVENAQLRLARHYKAGGGVSVDNDMAVRWLKAAAESGLPAAQFELGSWYMEGQCVPRNLALFVSWTREAAKNGDVRGLHNLGVAYEQGLGVEQNVQEAEIFYRKAAAKGCADSMTTLGDLCRDGILNNGKQAFDEAARWYRKAIEAGDDDALYQLFYLHARTGWANRDLEEAARLLVRSADAGDATAQHLLGIAYGQPASPAEAGRLASGRFFIPGFEHDDAKAVVWLRRAAEQGVAEAMVSLGHRMKRGIGTENDGDGARAWFERAASLGLPSAHRELAIMIVESAPTHDEHAEAVRLFQLAAEANDVFAMEHLAFHYETGLGVERDVEKASALERASIEIGQRKESGRREQRIARSGFRVVQ